MLTVDKVLSHSGGSAQGHKDAVALFHIAEALGYDKGWIRNGHFDHYVASPLTVLAPAGQQTKAIKLGTAIIPMGYEHPNGLAEDAATVDHLSDGRLEPGIAGGIPTFDRILHGEHAQAWPVAGLMSPVVVGDPSEIVAYLQSDAAVTAAGDLMIFLPPSFAHHENVELLENIALHVAPQLGWAPAV